jgi:ribonuclease-3
MVSRAQLNHLAIKLGISEIVKATKDRGSQPKSLNGDAFEAVIGAIYLDKGYNFTKKIIINRIYKVLLDLDELENTENNFKSRLIEWSQKEKIEIEFRHKKEVKSSGKNIHSIELFIDGKIVSKAKDFSIKGAEQSAAQKACEKIKSLSEKDK